MRTSKCVIWNLTKEDFEKTVNESRNYSDLLRNLGFTKINNSARKQVLKRIKKENIDTTHIKENYKNKEFLHIRKVTTADLLKNNKKVKSQYLKKRLIEDGVLQDICSKCNNGPIHNNILLVLQLDHINGDHDDNRLENLRILCPNCHSQTETFSNKKLKKTHKCKCGNKIFKRSKTCRKCNNIIRLGTGEKIEWPNDEDLIELVNNNGLEKTGKKIGVTGNTVKKRLKKRNKLQLCNYKRKSRS